MTYTRIRKTSGFWPCRILNGVSSAPSRLPADYPIPLPRHHRALNTALAQMSYAP